jgi:zinc protease
MHRNRAGNMARVCRVVAVAAMALMASAAQADIAVGTRTISHGVKAWYAQNDTVPVVDVVLSFEGAGYASDPAGKAGRAAFAAALLTEGAGALDSVAFRRALEEKAITIEAHVEEDRLNIHVYCLREHAVAAGALLAQALTKPTMAIADQQRMKADMVSLLSRLDERPNYHAQRQMVQRAFAGHPYANMPYGSAETLAALSATDVQEYMRTYVTRGNLLIAASGDVDERLLDSMLEPLVDDLPMNDTGAVAVTAITMQGGGENLNKTMDVPQTSILFAAPSVARDDKRFYAMYLLNHILGGGSLFSRLGEQVRQQQGLAYSVNSQLDVKRGTSLITGQLSTRNANATDAMNAVKNVLETLQHKGVTTQECTDAKSYVTGSFARQLDSNSSVSNLLLMMQIHGLGENYIKERNALFNDVSCADINSIAEEFLSPSRFIFSVVGGAPAAGETQAIPIPMSATPRHDDVK